MVVKRPHRRRAHLRRQLDVLQELVGDHLERVLRPRLPLTTAAAAAASGHCNGGEEAASTVRRRAHLRRQLDVLQELVGDHLH